MKKAIIISALLLGPLAGIALALAPTPLNTPGAGSQGPKPPVITALDTNQDGIISASEIADAPAALKTLDKNSNGKLTPDECSPPRAGNSGGPVGMGGPVCSSKSRDFQSRSGHGGTSGVSGSFRTTQTGNPGNPASGNGRPPKPPIETALDANQDGIISTIEITNASSALRKLDKNSDAQLTPDEYLPVRPNLPTNSQTR